jgi:hypothetical protein
MRYDGRGMQTPERDASTPDRPLQPLRRSHAIAAVAIALSLFFAPALFGPAVFAYRDTGRMHAPTKCWIGEELRAGRLPQWNPYAGLGVPVIGNGFDGVQHPFNLLLVALPPHAALSAWILASYALAAAGAFAWARSLRMSSAAAAIAAIAFALSGPLVSSSDNVTFLTTYAALPFVFAAGHAFFARGGPGRLALVALASAACAAGGDPQAWGFAVGLLPLYALAVADAGARAVALRRGLAAAAVAALAAAPFVLPILLWIGHSVRAGGIAPEELVRWNVHPARLVELGIPELFRANPAITPNPIFSAYAGNASTPNPWFLSLYLGTAVLALALLGVARDRVTRRLALAAIPLAWAATGHYAGFLAFARHVPLLGSFRYWEKLTVWLALLAAIAAARGVDALLERARLERFTRVAGAVGASLLALAATAALWPAGVHVLADGPEPLALELASNLAAGSARAGAVLALVALFAAAVRRGAVARAAPFALVALVALDLLGGNGGAYVLSRPLATGRPPLAGPLAPGDRVLSPFAARQDRWPDLDPIGNFWEWSRRSLDASWNVPLRLGAANDYVGLREDRWAKTSSALTGERLSGLGLFGFAYVVVPGNSALATRIGLAPPFGIVAEDPALPAWLVEVPHRPRAYVAEVATAATSEEALAFAMAGGAPGRTLVEGPVAPGLPVGAGAARLTLDVPGDTVVDARSSARALLVLNDAWAPGWVATVDGAPTPIFRANGLVRGVWIDAGEHTVRFRYSAPGLAVGWAVALALAAALGGWAVLRARRARPGLV